MIRSSELGIKVPRIGSFDLNKGHGMVMHENSTDLGVLEHAESEFLSITQCIPSLDGLLV